MALLASLSAARPVGGYMACNSACALLLLSTATLMARPDRGLCSLILSDSPGGATARRVLPMALLAPIALRWLLLQGQQAGLFELEIGTRLLVLPLPGLLVAVVRTTAPHP